MQIILSIAIIAGKAGLNMSHGQFTTKEKEIQPQKQKPDIGKILFTVMMWCLSSIMLVGALIYLFSETSIACVPMALFAVCALPSKSVQDFLKSKGLSAYGKAVILVVLFLVSLWLVPTK